LALRSIFQSLAAGLSRILRQYLPWREAGWSSHNLNYDNRYWGLRVNDPALAHSGHNYVVYFTGNQSQAANDWIISGCYKLDAGRKYKGAFFYRLGSGSHNLALAVGNAPVASALDQTIWQAAGMSAGSADHYQHVGDVFQVSHSGHYYFGIRQFSNPGQGSSIVDDLVIIAQPPILPIASEVQPGQVITINALGSDSLRWYADAALTQVLGQGTSLNYTVTQTEDFQIFAAEFVYGVMGPADTLDVEILTSVKTPAYNSSMHIFPNPASEILYIDLPGSMQQILSVEVHNVMGEKLIKLVKPGSQQISLNISQLPKGNYVVTIFSTKEKRVARFVKF
jgi:hypothetical protein